MNNSKHYDSISQAWQYLLGDHFHWGYFDENTTNCKEDILNFKTSLSLLKKNYEENIWGYGIIKGQK